MVTWRSIYAAEATYSSKRLKSLKEEWSEFYPHLEDSVEILRGLTSPFTRSGLSGQRFDQVSMVLHECEGNDPCVNIVKKYYSSIKPGITESDVISTIIQALYHAGIIGIKISSLDTFIWSYIDQPRISKSEVKRANQIKVHKMLHHALEIQVNGNNE